MYGIGKKIKDESGMILMASTMGIFIILSLLAFYLARFSITETRSGANYIQDIKTRNLAITGAEHGMQVYKELKSTSELTGNFNKGSYTVSFDLDNDEVNTSLPFTHYLTMKSSASIDDVKRNIRYILSSFPEAFCFSFYGNNASSETFNETGSYISGDMFFNGSVSIGSGTSNGITYISAGSGGTILSTYPEFPQIDNTLYDDLLASASLVSGSYTNYALDFNGSDQYIEIQNNSLINTGSSHTAKTIEAWFKVDNVDFNSYKQTIYEQGGTVRGLNIYIYDGLLYVGGWNEPDGESDWDPGTWLVTDADAITSGTWHHVALTLDASASGNTTNGILKGYLDGTEFGSGSGSKLWSHPGDVSIARHKDTKFSPNNDNSQAKFFSGSIDEVRLWNTVRTQSQINDNKDKTLTGDDLDGDISGLIVYYDFQDGNASDRETQASNNGTLKKGPSSVSGPELYKMNTNSYTNTEVYLNTLDDSRLLVNGNLDISGSTFHGSGYIVATGDMSISDSSLIKGDIFIICGGSLTISENSEIGESINAPVVLYSKGDASLTNSTVYGLIVSKGDNLVLNGTSVNGAILNYSASFSLTGNSDIVGSVVSNYSVDLQGELASITRGNIPEFSGLVIGLDPFVVPGSYLEY
tara:strand:+ start:2281 stop:4203 length:1923 start_codon:yes stop_codon:yes gene_type:complete